MYSFQKRKESSQSFQQRIIIDDGCLNLYGVYYPTPKNIYISSNMFEHIGNYNCHFIISGLCFKSKKIRNSYIFKYITIWVPNGIKQ